MTPSPILFLCHAFKSLLSLILKDIRELSFNEVQELNKKLLKYLAASLNVLDSVWGMRSGFRPQEGAHIVLLCATAMCGGAQDNLL